MKIIFSKKEIQKRKCFLKSKELEKETKMQYVTNKYKYNRKQ